MRLIDADNLKQYINDCKHCEVCERREFGCNRECELPDFLTSIWEEAIDQQPTAYDVDKVLTDIEKFADCEDCRKHGIDKEFYYGQGCKMCTFGDVIEIVKRGVVE